MQLRVRAVAKALHVEFARFDSAARQADGWIGPLGLLDSIHRLSWRSHRAPNRGYRKIRGRVR
jgi:hypothetical protein